MIRAKSLGTLNRLVSGRAFYSTDLFTVHDARSLASETRQTKKWLFTCEHAGNALPPGYAFGKSDVARGLPNSHWAFDIGSAKLAKELAEATASCAVLATYSRLLVDLNRPLGSPNLARKSCDGKPVELNVELTDVQRQERIDKFYSPYHVAVAKYASEIEANIAISVHSFTSDYEGVKRSVEIGVLGSINDSIAQNICRGFSANNYDARVNEPWSGKNGFMHSVDSLLFSCQPQLEHSVMVEVRNDLLLDCSWRRIFVTQFVQELEDALSSTSS